ncbi:hypothetical protein [Macrococcus sp. DPC7161]|uniref:hypothetical protein n=1 Tax=Macrococcus sp. DPC7161 TaxID=2507060 RepID=UPI00100B7F3A|nr:hypothetical protein [Macrococcus sp. DPC7161]RXK19187.1 hypothetical protein ER639_02400 [Macrococcus sp. DPC7161]
MAIIIIGGSGMLYHFSEWMTEASNETVLLCSRNNDKYNPLLQQKNAKFTNFDYTAACEYEKLMEVIKDEPVTMIVAWIHSPYYDSFNSFIKKPEFKNTKVYLVQGTTSRTYQFDTDITLIKLGRHESENRWLTHQEISEVVIKAVKNK